MKTRALASALVFSALSFAGFASTANEPAVKATEAWTSLFDGHSLAGWRGYKTEAPGAGWTVVNGAIVFNGKGGDLVTIGEYGDFDFSFEWKVSEAANSGVIYRVGMGENAPYTTGPEYQVLDNDKATDNKKHNHLAGSLYDLALEQNAVTKPVGEWNTGRIMVRGWHIQHWLNGQKVVDVDLASAEGKALVAASKFKDWTKFASLSRGHIALQDHGYVVSYRNLEIRELK